MLDIQKSADNLRLNLSKKGVTKVPSCQVAFALDVSGSFDSSHRSGETQHLLDRLVPWGLVFDANKTIDVFTFSDGEDHVSHVGDLNEGNYAGYIRDNVINRVRGYNGGTDYHYVLDEILENFGWGVTQKREKPGLLSRIFGSPKEEVKASGKGELSICLFVTDGESFDEAATEELLRASQDRGDKVFFMMIGVGHSGFGFLKRMDREFRNVGFVTFKDLSKLQKMSDDELNDAMIGDKVINWLKD